MNKKLWIGFIVMFVLWSVLSFIVHVVILGSAYQSEEMMKIWRPDMESKMWMYYVVNIIMSFFFTLIFSKWYKGKGIIEGLQYGVYTGLLMATPMAYSTYAMIPIPYSITIQWFIYGLIHYIILGIVLAMIFGKKRVENSTA